jgi:opacity protein-like surface antigen
MPMNSIKTVILTSLFTATSSSAMSADLARAFNPSAPVFRESRDSTLGWYLRGEIGYVHHKRPEADFAADPFAGGFARESLGNAGAAGVGLGYRFNANVRADVTADHRFNARFKGIAPTPTFASASLEDRAHFNSTTFMVNGYLDFRPVGGFTPYVGAGLGVARNVLSHYRRTTIDAVAGTET